MDSKGNDRKSVCMLVSSMLIWGTIGVFRKYIPLSSAFLAFSRGMLGGLFLLTFVKLRRKRIIDGLPARTVLQLAVTGAAMGINWILLFEAYNHTTVAVATLCYYMQPVIVMFLSPLIFREKLTKKKVFCATVAIIGMVLVSGVIGSEGGPVRNTKGILLGLGAAALYSAVVIMNKRIHGIGAYGKTTIQLFSAGAALIPYLILDGGFRCGGFSTGTAILLLVVGILHTGIAYLLYFGSMDGLKAQSVAILSYIDPVAALLFSATFLREPLSVPGIAGAVMIIGSAIFSEIQGDTK